MTAGHATNEGTERYRTRMSFEIQADHFRQTKGLMISSIGVGTYLGETDEATDKNYESAIGLALERGCNLLDSAINYRYQRSERNVGAALLKSINDGKVSRDEIIVSTKGGFLSFDGDYPQNPSQYIFQNYVESGICKPEEIAAGCHCMTPAYFENQLERSLKNLQLDCIDIYLIHNPETQLSEISRQEFMKRILAAFKHLEKKVSEGKIRMYGVATWNGLREDPGDPAYLSLEDLVGLARNAGGEDHHFGAIQLPYNLGMPEAFLKKNQKFGSRSVSCIEAAHRQGMIVLCSASILQGRLAANLPDSIVRAFPQLTTDAQRSIQFVRSTPGVTTALIGMSRVKHVEENLHVAKIATVPAEKMNELFFEA